MHKIYGMSPYEIMPSALQNPEAEALGYAVKQALKEMLDYTQGISLYADIKNVSDDVLNMMAQELRTQYYDPQAPRTIREQLVENTLPWYMHGGTKSVLEEYLATLYGGGRISEWHEYGGDPYYFKATVAVDEDVEINLGDSREIVKRIDIYKNVRSWLEALIFQMTFHYNVPIRYENRITLQTEFYPRYNLGFLYLDGTWKLDGSRYLNGYNGGSRIDFYPVAVSISVEVDTGIQAGSGMGLQTAYDIRPVLETGIGIRSEQTADISVNTEVGIQTAVPWTIGAGAGVTKMNLLNGTWKLDGSRKLDGGREQI